MLQLLSWLHINRKLASYLERQVLSLLARSLSIAKMRSLMPRTPADLEWPHEMAFIKATADVHRQLPSLGFTEIKKQLQRVEREYKKRALVDSHTGDEVPSIIERRVWEMIWLAACIKKIPFAEGKELFEELQKCQQDDQEHTIADSISFAHFCRYHSRKQMAIEHLTELRSKLIKHSVRRSSRHVKSVERVLRELSDDE